MCKHCPPSHFSSVSFLANMDIGQPESRNLAMRGITQVSKYYSYNLFLPIFTGSSEQVASLSASYSPLAGPPSAPHPLALDQWLKSTAPPLSLWTGQLTIPAPGLHTLNITLLGPAGTGRAVAVYGRAGPVPAQRDPARLCGLSGRGAGAGAGPGVAEPGPAEQRQLVSRSVQ